MAKSLRKRALFKVMGCKYETYERGWKVTIYPGAYKIGVWGHIKEYPKLLGVVMRQIYRTRERLREEGKALPLHHTRRLH